MKVADSFFYFVFISACTKLLPIKVSSPIAMLVTNATIRVRSYVKFSNLIDQFQLSDEQVQVTVTLMQQ